MSLVFEEELSRNELAGLQILLKATLDLARSRRAFEDKPRKLQPPPSQAAGQQQDSVTKQLFLEKLQHRLKKLPLAEASQSQYNPAEALQETFQTDADFHENNPVSCLAFAAALPGLAGGGVSNSGWLVSASINMLNLWECGRGQDSSALQLMHSQVTDFKQWDMKLDRTNKLLLAAAKQTEGHQRECLALHSIDAQSGMFAPKRGMPIPPNAFSGHLRMSWSSDGSQVESLSHLGGPLKACAAASFGGYITIYPLLSGATASPKLTWQAHSAHVTKLACSSHSVDLFSGAMDGTVYRWSLRDKPKAPSANFIGLKAAIRGLAQVGQHHLIAASKEGLLCIWDLQNPDSPLLYIDVPGNRPVQDMIVCKLPDSYMAAFTTDKGGLYTVPVNEPFERCKVQQAVLQQSLPTVQALAWNPTAKCLYAAAGGGIVVLHLNSTTKSSN